MITSKHIKNCVCISNQILTVEWNTITKEGLPEYMKSVGYTTVKSVHFNYGLDLIFEKKSK